MESNPTRWLAEFRIEADLSLAEGSQELVYAHPRGEFEVHIANAPKDDSLEDETLVFKLIFPASDISAAAQVGEDLLLRFLHVLCFITSVRFRLSRKIHLTDWTKGTDRRQQHVYSTHRIDQPQPLLSSALLETAHMLHSWGTTPLLDRALRWYAAGVRSSFMEDQFQYFWFVIELIAVATKPSERVADKCQTCGGDLFCEKCGPSRHRPFQRQAIEILLAKVNLSREIIDTLLTIRNELMHGEPCEEIEERIQAKVPDFTFAKAVDKIGRTAWMVILNAFRVPSGKFQPQFFEIATYVASGKMTAAVHMIVALGKDPKVEDVSVKGIKLSLIEPDGTELPQSKL